MINTQITRSSFFQNICIILIWITALYSAIIQYMLFQVPYGMVIFGIAILATFILANNTHKFNCIEMLTEESIYMGIFMIYMLLSGLLFSPNREDHISQWITCIEYLFIQIVISSIIKNTKTYKFHYLLFVEALIISIIIIVKPANYGGRYSISSKINPNEIGIALSAGIWAILHINQRKKYSYFIIAISVILFGYSIILTSSRKALIATGLMIILWLLFCFLPDLKNKSIYRSVIAFIFMIVLIVIIGREFVNTYSESAIAGRMDKLLYESTEGKRSNMYRIGYELIMTNPLFGLGFQGFSYFYGTYSHATIIEIPVSGGVVGTILYFIAYFVSIRKAVRILKITKGKEEYYSFHTRIKLVLVLWAVMLFYTTCIIHPYQLESYIMFGIILGDIACIEKGIHSSKNIQKMKNKGSKYIKNA